MLIPGIPRRVRRGWSSPPMPPNLAFFGRQEPVPLFLKTQGSFQLCPTPQPKLTIHRVPPGSR